MSPLVVLSGVGAALLIGAMSPGPSFVLVARRAAVASRAEALATAAGMGAGAVVLASLALLGLQALMQQAGWPYAVARWAGGSYLLYLGWLIWHSAPVGIGAGNLGKAGIRGLLRSAASGAATQVSNPKTIVVYGSVFAALVPPDIPGWATAALPAIVFVVETGWYGVVAFAFSLGGPRRAYARSETTVNRVAGGVMGALGIRLLWSSTR